MYHLPTVEYMSPTHVRVATLRQLDAAEAQHKREIDAVMMREYKLREEYGLSGRVDGRDW